MDVKTLILGAGAAGMMTAAHAGPGVLVVDHAKAPGEKIRISGGGRCNFTNMYCEPQNYLGENKHFHKSALSRYTQWDFIELVGQHGIAWHEKTLGQLFCDDKATQIVSMLLAEMDKAGADLWLQTSVLEVAHRDGHFVTRMSREGREVTVTSDALVLATGGKSIPKMGATGLAYDIARQFGHEVTETRPGLVPFTFDKGRFSALSGTAVNTRISNDKAGFEEAMLFTHRGLSGPAILQISSYWREGEEVVIDLLPQTNLAEILRTKRRTEGKRALTTELGHHLPSRVVEHLSETFDFKGNLGDLSDSRIDDLCTFLGAWALKPTGTEGYRTAEVTLGGISTEGLSAKTMESKHIPGLHVVGEAADVTGWLGGYNFQWAWSSGWAAGQAIRQRRQ
ncbi:NAD(P)/FAD-dependent oxidoreductase [Tropicibacter naphthalenivorans]|uniref:Flavoprotein, family n=1 Tax=Tropicibacter naphthalenivorans TaxID=441103 RepID=A0A0P1G332_9RHOB|nr:NAD(P)/FAD-dependent oxidoreductase [Tropicibacter naphthalenivorans]CUH76085.1 flavoprotein, family [Tropicibacter naphthalenivorans]SMC40125.1 hypothetical protein SAMN04488093_101111 [Tropicibacter naphthalenivorans]